MTYDLDAKVDKAVVTYEFLRDISNSARRMESGIGRLGVEAAEEAYITFRKHINKGMRGKGQPLLSDSEIMGRITKDEDFYELSIKLILLHYRSKKIRQSLKIQEPDRNGIDNSGYDGWLRLE